jgi:adhesin/invasin
MQPVFRQILAAGIIASAIACGSDDSTSPTTPKEVQRVSADSVSTAVGVAMTAPLVVEVVGGDGSALMNTSVVWRIVDGGGTLSDTTVVTDASGHAQTTYTPGTTPGAAHVMATAGSVSSTFSLTLVAGAASALQKFGSDNPAAVVGSTLTLSVKLVDQYGNGIANATINWSADGGSIAAATSVTDSAGVANVTYTVGETAGTYLLTATYGELPPLTFSITAI